MKLAEALIERADLQKRIDQLDQRLCSNALVQDGDEPAEDPTSLLAELDSLMKRLCEVIAAVNITNSRTEIDGMTITEMIAVRDCLTKKISILRDFNAEASRKAMRGRSTDILIKSTVQVKELQKSIDALSKQLREIDTRIQAANWVTELIID